MKSTTTVIVTTVFTTFRYVFGRFCADSHYIHAEQSSVSDADGLISFYNEAPVSEYVAVILGTFIVRVRIHCVQAISFLTITLKVITEFPSNLAHSIVIHA